MDLLNVGDKAPPFDKEAHDGTRVDLQTLSAERTVVLYFYPRDETPGCTKEACGFRDAFEEFNDAGAAVVGVSADSLQSHREFAEKHDLPFLLISDEDGAMREAYRVPKTFGLFDGRVTFVIDKEGVIRHVFNSQLFATRHIGEALDVVKQLAA